MSAGRSPGTANAAVLAEVCAMTPEQIDAILADQLAPTQEETR